MWFDRQVCHSCSEFGISCERRGWLDNRKMRGVSSVIKIETLRRNFECLESINNCPIVRGRLPICKTVEKIKSTINKISGFVIQPVLVSRSSDEIKIPGIDS